MKTLKIVLIVLAVVLLIITAVIYFIDTPVVEEGEEPTVAQKIILLGKEYLSEILLVLGVSGVGLLSALTQMIYNSAKRTLTQSASTSADVQNLGERILKAEATIGTLITIVNKLNKKQDIANNMLLTTFELSELPQNVRAQIHSAREEYNKQGDDNIAVLPATELAQVVVEEPAVAVEQSVEEKESEASKPNLNLF